MGQNEGQKEALKEKYFSVEVKKGATVIYECVVHLLTGEEKIDGSHMYHVIENRLGADTVVEDDVTYLPTEITADEWDAANKDAWKFRAPVVLIQAKKQ